MTENYKIKTKKLGDGDYETLVTYNDKPVDFIIPENLALLIDEIGLNNIKALSDNKNLGQLEVIISGENLK